MGSIKSGPAALATSQERRTASQLRRLKAETLPTEKARELYDVTAQALFDLAAILIGRCVLLRVETAAECEGAVRAEWLAMAAEFLAVAKSTHKHGLPSFSALAKSALKSSH